MFNCNLVTIGSFFAGCEDQELVACHRLVRSERVEERRRIDHASTPTAAPDLAHIDGCARPSLDFSQLASDGVDSSSDRDDWVGSLNDMFVEDLGGDMTVEGDQGAKPLLLARSGQLPRLQVYLWRATAPFERQTGAHKIQITLPGQPRGSRIHIPRESGRMVIFGGYAKAFNVWILWDAELFLTSDGISWSRNLQVPVEALADAVRLGTVVATKNVRATIVGSTDTTIVVARRSRLRDAIAERFALNIARSTGARV